MITVIDFETSKVPRHLPWTGGYPVCVTLLTGMNTWQLVLNHNENKRNQADQIQQIRSILDKTTVLVAHNMKFELAWLNHLGVVRKRELQLWCTRVVEYIVSGQSLSPRQYDLDSVCRRRGIPVKTDLVQKYWDCDYETDEIPLRILLDYNLWDCKITQAVYAQQVREVMNEHIIPLVTLSMKELEVLCQIEQNGMLLDLEHLKREYDINTGRIEQLTEELRRIAGVDVNPDSPNQLSSLLFGGSYDVGTKEWVHFKNGNSRERNSKLTITLPGIFPLNKDMKRGKGGYYSVDKAVISELKPKTKDQRRILEIITELSRLQTLVGTFYGGLLQRQIGGYAHPSMNQTVARTGRLSSSNPNLQNQPRTGEVKRGFTSRYRE